MVAFGGFGFEPKPIQIYRGEKGNRIPHTPFPRKFEVLD
jgi:hypothetical protein